MKIRVFQNTMVIASELKAEQILLLSQVAPEILKATDEEDNEIFRVAFGDKASFSNYGVVFNKIDAEGKAFLSILLPDHVEEENRVRYIVTVYGLGIEWIEKFEATIPEKVERLETVLDTMSEKIEIIG